MPASRSKLVLTVLAGIVALVAVAITMAQARTHAAWIGAAAASAAASSLALSRRERNRREGQLEAMYASLKEVSSAADIREVLTTVADHAAQALGASAGAIMIREGDDLRTYSGTKPEITPVANAIGSGAFTTDLQLPSVRVIGTGTPLAIDDVDAYRGPPGFHEACRIAGILSVLVVPIQAWDRVTGSLNLGFAEHRSFGAHEIGLAGAYAEQAASALERALVFRLEQDARRAMQELSDLKSDFLASVGNQLQTPLTSISGFSDLLENSWDELDDSARRRFAARIGSQAKELSSLIDDLLEMRGHTSQRVGRLEELDLRLLVLGSVARILDDLASHNVRVEIPEGTSVWTRPAALERVLQNLLSNALKFSPAKSTIEVSAAADGDFVVVSVVDRGKGMEPSDQARIFDRFYRADRKDTSPSGAGIGLPVTKKLVEAMGGKIWVTSTPGEGSTFSFSLRAARYGENVSPGELQEYPNASVS